MQKKKKYLEILLKPVSTKNTKRFCDFYTIRFWNCTDGCNYIKCTA